MKRISTLLISILLLVTLLTGCAGNTSKPSGTSSPAATESSAANVKIAIITDTIGVNPFLTQVVAAAKDLQKEKGFKYSIMECADQTNWEGNVNAAVQEGYNLIIGVGWQAAEYINNAATKYPDKAKYAVIDTVVDNPNVASYNFRAVEGAYLMGVMAASAFPDAKVFGGVYAFQSQAVYEYRWGYMEGVKSINPNAQFMANYSNSFTDTNAPYEYALQQQAAGAKFIFGCAAAGDAGIFQAALKKGEAGTPIYTNGQDVDETTDKNKYILSSQLKNTGAVTTQIINNFLDGKFTGGVKSLGVAEGAIDIVNASEPGGNYLNKEIITPKVMEAVAKARQAIIDGQVKLVVPMEQK